MAEIGRWATVDPLAEKYQSWSLYHYTMNSLIIMTDPTGIAPMHIDVSMNGDGTIQERMERGTKSGVSSAKMVKEMGKILVVAILAYFVFLMASVLMSDGVKYVYCLSDDKCVTVWKKSNGEVYLIPDKYQSDEKPTVSHIKTISRQFLTLYFSSGEGFSDKIIVRDEGNLLTNRKMYSIENDSTGKWEFVEYSDTLRALLYKPNATKFKDVNEGVDYLIINIEENYATDKTGKDIH